jgi:hypothetical protein
MGSLFGFDAKGGSKDEFERKLREAQDEVRRNGGKIEADSQSGKVTVTRTVSNILGGYDKTKEID